MKGGTVVIALGAAVAGLAFYLQHKSATPAAPLLSQLSRFWNSLVDPVTKKGDTAMLKAFAVDRKKALAFLASLKRPDDQPSEFERNRKLANSYAAKVGVSQFT